MYDDAQELLDQIVREGLLTARGVHGFWPASSDGEDIAVEDDVRFCMLRQQSDYGDSRPNRSLADYVAPAGDHLGAFAVGHLRRGRARGSLRGRARRLPARS